MALCDGCKQSITDRRFLQCSFCNKHYDLECANVSEARFYNTLTPEKKKNWKCPTCVCKAPKTNNQNTPLRPTSPDQYVTMRKRQNQSFKTLNQSLNRSIDTDRSVDEIGDDTRMSPQNNSGDTITLSSISQLLDTKLENIKSSLLSDIKNTIQAELNIAIKNLQEDVNQKTNELKIEQNTINEKITTIDTKIKNIEEQLNTLMSPKKIVLFGIPEQPNETEYDLYDRVSRVFHDIMNININPYIEEIKRIGKTGRNRPLAIELLNKRMTKYVIENCKCFKNTGIAVDLFMEGEKLQKRNTLRKNLQEARKNGHHAIIKNNKLFINGKETTVDAIQNIPTTSKDIKYSKKDNNKATVDKAKENSKTTFRHSYEPRQDFTTGPAPRSATRQTFQ